MSDTQAKPLTAGAAMYAVMRGRWRTSFVLPTFTPAGWWECDVFELTKAGYMREYEVKMTRADFFADGRKEHSRWGMADGKWQRRPTEAKHDLLAAGDPRGPTRFWYVTPAGLVTPEELPAWAGLIEIDEYTVRGRRYGWALRQVKDAPQLHRKKIAKGAMLHARGICYWRMHNLLAARYRAGQEPIVEDAAAEPAAAGGPA